ncbi:unnamed protein product [Cuscuta europaea]|uniref:Uncharacterized protein n=1 Tax=Cuscuta europaea TaxID=41803 RepID=A0A9P1E2B0_CUSEU|nr:unnamed protein product [Cuscuta europaea]
MDERRLVIQLINGLPTEYDNVASSISQSMSSFETARSQLRTEEQRRAQQSLTPPTALAVSEPQSARDSTPSAMVASHPHRQVRGAGNHGRRSSSHETDRRDPHRRDVSRDQFATTPLMPGPPEYQPWPIGPPYWALPPCPYPTVPAPSYWAAPTP